MSKITLVEQSVDPAPPATTRRTLYAKSDGIYEIDAGGVVTSLVAGGGGGGEVNDGTNLGAGEGVYAGKSSSTLQFKSLLATSPLSISSTVDEITYALTGEISDVNHGSRSGGSLHALATTSVAGFMSSTDKSKLDGVEAGATNTSLTATAPVDVDRTAAAVGIAAEAARADHKHDVAVGVPVGIGTANAEGTASTLARSNHVHAHGDQGGGTLHALATISVAGFMSSTDKTKLDGFGAATEYLRADGTVTFTAAQSLGNQDLTTIKTATFNAEFDQGNSGAAATINWNNGQKQRIVLTNTSTLSFTDPPGPCNLMLKLTQDATGGRDVTWPANVLWSQGLTPNLTVNANAVDLVSFYFDGTDYYGFFADNFS